MALPGCGDDEGDSTAASSTTTPSTASSEGHGTTTDGGTPSTSTGADGPHTTDPGGGPATTGGPGATQGRPDPGAPAPDATGPPGSFATELLGAATGSRLLVEVQAEQGIAPRPASLDHSAALLRAASGKDVAVTSPRRVSGSGASWTDDEIRSAADRAAGTGQGGGRVVLRLLFVRGSYAGGEGALGVAVRGDVAALFVDEIDRAAALGIGAAEIERAVVAHEVGHLLGLVDLALDTGREDPQHPGHSRNRASVMYWAVESDLVGQVLEGGPPDDFDERDRADLARLRERGSR